MNVGLEKQELLQIQTVPATKDSLEAGVTKCVLPVLHHHVVITESAIQMGLVNVLATGQEKHANHVTVTGKARNVSS